MTSVEASTREKLSYLPREEREAVYEAEARKNGLPVPVLKARTSKSWRFIARPKQLPPDGDWMFWFLLCGRGFGKLLSNDTPLPTPSGWTTMGDVQVGDDLIDEAGRPTRVTWKSDSQTVEAYRVRFSDGSEILACADHQWVTWDHPARKAYGRSPYEDSSVVPEDWPAWRLRRMPGTSRLSRETVEEALVLVAAGASERSAAGRLRVARRALTRHIKAGCHVPRTPRIYPNSPGPQIRTTAEIAATLRQGKRGDLNHSIPVTAPLELPEADLPVLPYVLGYWLGDGTSATGQLTIHPDDQQSFFEQAACYEPRQLNDPNRIGTRGLQRDLRELGVLANKHVPPAYLRASAGQRLALLQGLMDSDGYASGETSHVEFVSTLSCLADAVAELARSLGEKPVIASGRSRLNGHDHKTKYRVTWRPTVVPFRLARKAERVKPLALQGSRSRHRMIVSVEATGICLPMHCVAVDSPHRMYLAGDAMIPTHNTLTAAQWTKSMALERKCRIGLIAPTLRDVRGTMVEGETGMLSILPTEALLGQSREIAWNKSLLQLTLANGTIIEGFSSDVPDRLRGPQHDYVWAEEVSSWLDASKGAAVGSEMNTTWSNMILGLRLGERPRACLTSTPKANRLTRELVADQSGLVVVSGSSYENQANLSDHWWRNVVEPLRGTRTGRQEIEAEILEDVEGALWTRAMIDEHRVSDAPQLGRIVVAVDPNTTSGEASDDAGIVVVGRGHSDRHGYVLADHTVTRGGPAAWALAAVRAYHEFQADRVVAEANNGGEMVAITIRSVDASVPVKIVHASRGKRTRAEPVASLYTPLEGIRDALVHHVGSAASFADLEDEMTTWTGDGESPNRMDALVWALTELNLWQPVGQHRSGYARGGRRSIPGAKLGDGLGELSTGAGIGGYTSG